LAQHPSSALFDLEYVRVLLRSAADGADTGGEAHFDNVRGVGPGNGKWCPSRTLTDDFQDGQRADTWLLSGGDSTAVGMEYNGELYLTVPVNVEGAYYVYRSARLFDFKDGGMAVELVQTPNEPGAAYMRATGRGQEEEGEAGSHTDNVLQIAFEDGKLVCNYAVDSFWTTVAEVAFSPTAHRFWRVRQAGDSIVWEAAPDGANWDQVGMVAPVPVDTSRLDLQLGVVTPDANPDPGQARFDNFNLLPKAP
jgi:hypothetical protein